MRLSLILLAIPAAIGGLLFGLQSSAQANVNLPNRGAAPELHSLNWINSAAPLRLANLHGNVVLLEFWTFDCINCIHTIPYVEQWYQTYHTQGLQVIGIHFPEFGFEHDFDNVDAATKRLNITYPVGIDNDGATWNAYNQMYWPTLYLIDKQGNIRYLSIGEGNYDQTEQAIQTLLAEPDNAAQATEQPSALTYVTPNAVVTVRSAADARSSTLGSIHPGMAFVVLKQQANWVQISYNDATGYVDADAMTVHTA